jgi:hypothetical protein
MRRYVPSLGNCIFYPFLNNLANYGAGNGSTWTETGTTTVAVGPPVLWDFKRRRTNAKYSGSAGPLAYEQEGFRFRNDDGSESTATWKASQDTNVTAVKSANTRLRVLTDTANADPATKRMKLQYRKVGDDGWRDLKE